MRLVKYANRECKQCFKKTYNSRRKRNLTKYKCWHSFCDKHEKEWQLVQVSIDICKTVLTYINTLSLTAWQSQKNLYKALSKHGFVLQSNNKLMNQVVRHRKIETNCLFSSTYQYMKCWHQLFNGCWEHVVLVYASYVKHIVKLYKQSPLNLCDSHLRVSIDNLK